MMLAEKPKL